jgi:hypothetical protein
VSLATLAPTLELELTVAVAHGLSSRLVTRAMVPGSYSEPFCSLTRRATIVRVSSIHYFTCITYWLEGRKEDSAIDAETNIHILVVVTTRVPLFIVLRTYVRTNAG